MTSLNCQWVNKLFINEYLNYANKYECKIFVMQPEQINIMKLNFIKNLSDEIIKQNYDLKNQIITLKKQTKNYQEQMLACIMAVTNTEPLYENPTEILKAFIREIKINHSQTTTAQKQCLSKQKIIDQLNSQNRKIQLLLRQQQKKTQSFKESLEDLTKQLESNKIAASQKEQNYQSECVNLTKQLTQMNQNMKFNILKLQEEKRNEVEDIRLYHNQQFIEFRQKMENQNVNSEKILREEIQNKDRTIKELTKTIEKIVSKSKLDDYQSDFIKAFFEPMKQLADNMSLNDSLKKQAEKYKAQLYEALNVKYNLESHIQSLNVIQQNLKSKLERMFLQKLEIETRLLNKMKEIQKSEKDKQSMELYYDQKWHSQYNKVKKHLEKKMEEKIISNQLEFNKKIKQTDRLTESYLIKIIKIENQNKQILNKLSRFDSEKKILEQQIINAKNKIENQRKQTLQIQKMTDEQIKVWRMMRTKQRQQKKELKAYFQNQIKSLNKNLLERQLQYKKWLEGIEKQYEQKILELKQLFELQKKQIEKENNVKIQKLIQKYSKNIESIQQIEKQLEIEFNVKLSQKDLQLKEKLKENEQQFVKKVDKYTTKYKQMQLANTRQKQKHSSDLKALELEYEKLQKQNQNMRLLCNNQQSIINEFSDRKQEYELQIKNYQNSLSIIESKYNEKVQENHRIEKHLKFQKKEVEILKHDKDKWEDQLKDLERSYKIDFDDLKRLQEKQMLFYRSKVWELEEISKKRMIQKKDFDKIKHLCTEKEELQNTIHVRQAENIILNQVKDYYEVKLRQTESKLGFQANQFKTPQTLSRRPKRAEFYTSLRADSQRIFEMKEIKEMKKYIKNTSYHHQMNSLNKHKIANYTKHQRFNSSMS